MIDQSSCVMSACSARLARALRRCRAVGAPVAGRHALIHTFLAQLRNAIFGLPGQDPCPLAPPSPFSPPKPAPSHPHTRQGISPWGGKPGGLGLRAWRRLSAVGCCGTHPCGLSAAGASGWFRRACPLTRARCAPLPPALRADARLRRKMREHLSQMHELKRHPVAVSSGNLIRKGLKKWVTL